MHIEGTEIINIDNLVLHSTVLNLLKEKLKKMSPPKSRNYSTKKIDIYVLDTEFTNEDMEEEYLQAYESGEESIKEFVDNNSYDMSLIRYLRLYSNGVVEVNYETNNDFDNDPKGFGVYFDTVEDFLNL